MLALSAALLVFLACVVAFYAWRAGTLTEGQKRVQDQLRRISMIGRDSTVDPTILRDKRLSDITFIDRFLAQFPLSKDLELLLYQAGLNWRVGTLVLLMLLTGAVFFLLCVTILGRPLVGLLIGIVTALCFTSSVAKPPLEWPVQSRRVTHVPPSTGVAGFVRISGLTPVPLRTTALACGWAPLVHQLTSSTAPAAASTTSMRTTAAASKPGSSAAVAVEAKPGCGASVRRSSVRCPGWPSVRSPVHPAGTV